MSVTNGIFHPMGGTILHIPYFFAVSDIEAIYAMGSLNCSGVGWNVGQSVRPNGLGVVLGTVGLVFGVLTEDKSNVGATGSGGPSLSWMRMPPSSVIESPRFSSPELDCAWECRAARASDGSARR